MEYPKDIDELAANEFDKYDKDFSCYIEHNELKKILGDLARKCNLDEPSEADVDRIKQDVDKNNDNRISKREFLELFKTMWQIKNKKPEDD